MFVLADKEKNINLLNDNVEIIQDEQIINLVPKSDNSRRPDLVITKDPNQTEEC